MLLCTCLLLTLAFGTSSETVYCGNYAKYSAYYFKRRFVGFMLPEIYITDILAVIWLSLLLLQCGDIEQNPGPQSDDGVQDFIIEDEWNADLSDNELVENQPMDYIDGQNATPANDLQLNDIFSDDDQWDMETLDEWNEADEEEWDLRVEDQWQDPRDFYQLGEAEQRYVKRYETTASSYPLNFQNLDRAENLHNLLPEIFQHAVEEIVRDAEPNDRIGAELCHPDMRRPILIPFRNRNQINGRQLIHNVERILQSNEQVQLTDEGMKIRLVKVTPPEGKGHHRRQCTNLDKLLHKKQCFIQIKNKDNLCLARSLAVSIARLEHLAEPDNKQLKNRFVNLCRGDSLKLKMQQVAAMKIMEVAGLHDHYAGCGIPELNAIQATMPDYRIRVFDSQNAGSVIFLGQPAPKVINLYLHDNHYTVITSLPAFFDRSYFCEQCNVPYNERNKHRCPNICPCCHTSPQCDNVQVKELILCGLCNRYFRGRQCLLNHHKRTDKNIKGKTEQFPSVCQRVQRCENCSKHMQGVRNIAEHKCDHFYCRTCRQNVPHMDHKCYMQPIQKEDDEPMLGDINEELMGEDDFLPGFGQDEELSSSKSKKVKAPLKFVFYDFETRQETAHSFNEYGTVFTHEPNLCIAHVVCDNCRNVPVGHCTNCGDNRQVFSGDLTGRQFCDFLFGLNNAVAIAHNSQGFDGHFIMQYLYKQDVEPKIITRGLKIISITVGSVRLIDSYNFLPMALSGMPKAFDEPELKKGYFPHLFNTEANQNYNGPWPEAYYYSPAAMAPKARDAFYRWYNQQIGKEFNFQQEFYTYCESDVDILRRCCLKFRDMFMAQTNMDPFDQSCTIAGACNRFFRATFLKEDTIGIVPHGGYRRKDKQSVVAIKWLKWLSHDRQIEIRHVLNYGEQKIGQYKVDGICGKTIFEFHGCYWHGCLKCMTRRHQLTADQIYTAEEAYQRTVKRIKELEFLGYTIEEIWECQYNRQLREHSGMRAFVDNISLVEPLDPREAFYGGRTNATKLYHKVATDGNSFPTEKIRYTDICSLYPTVNKYGEYPIGHPNITTENFRIIDGNNQPYNGLIKATVLPPRNLYHPVLPYRTDGKLLFPLCRTCAETKQQDQCQHNDQERAITGAWITLEFYKAIEKGYSVLKVFEVWHYDKIERYDPVINPAGGLFTSYIHKFMKTKQEADGWPSWVNNEQDKIKYVNDYFKREGITLDPENIKKNPGLRQLAKIMLNSFWGKFGQRNNLCKTTIFRDPAKYFDLITDPSVIIHSINIISDKLISVTHTNEDDFVEVMGNTNVVLAAYTTAQARLRLYKHLEQLDKRVLYFDTDSVIFLSNDGRQEYQVPIGSYLGDMTDELKDYGPGSYITQFVSGGPKNYGYIVKSGHNGKEYCVIKVRGFTLNYATSSQVNFKSLRKMVWLLVKRQELLSKTVAQNQIVRTSDHDILTKTTSKTYRVVYDKRQIMPDFTTLPYGY